MCNMFVEFCHRVDLGVRVESDNGLTPDLSHTLNPFYHNSESLSEGAAAEEAETRKHKINYPKILELGWV